MTENTTIHHRTIEQYNKKQPTQWYASDGEREGLEEDVLSVASASDDDGDVDGGGGNNNDPNERGNTLHAHVVENDGDGHEHWRDMVWN